MTTSRAWTLFGAVCAAALVAPSAARAQDEQSDSCRTCHETFGDTPLGIPARDYSGDVHAAKGLGCVACHGGDATASGFDAMDPAKGFIGKPSRTTVLQVCGNCHSNADFMRRYNPSLRVDQVAEYRTSVHGQRLTEFSDTSVATCINCHPAHNIRPPSDPLSSVHPLNVSTTCGACHADSTRMAPYGLATNQREQYEQSIHWHMMSDEGDLSAPTCNDCHGNHGAAPPGVNWVGNVCGQCHAVMADYFRTSVHARVFTVMGMPGCVACHNNHRVVAASDEFLGLGEGAVCARCHTEGVSGGIAAVDMRSLIDSLTHEYDMADSLLERAERAGVEVSQALFDLGGARNALVQSRAAVHSFNVDSVTAHVAAGREITATGIEEGHRALGELRFRRTGLAVSVTIILVVIAGLILRIREIER